jgi:hypothetical protein
MVEERVWDKDHRYKIIRMAERVSTEKLKRIATIVDYKV